MAFFAVLQASGPSAGSAAGGPNKWNGAVPVRHKSGVGFSVPMAPGAGWVVIQTGGDASGLGSVRWPLLSCHGADVWLMSPGGWRKAGLEEGRTGAGAQALPSQLGDPEPLPPGSLILRERLGQGHQLLRSRRRCIYCAKSFIVTCRERKPS